MTPTPPRTGRLARLVDSDPFNLALMFVPLYGLFELGLAGMGWVEKKAALA